jgi:hypothetical protein
MGNMVSENQVINQYKKIGFISSNIQTILKDINDFLFKRNNSFDFWKNDYYDGETYYLIFRGNKERISYEITPHLYEEWK